MQMAVTSPDAMQHNHQRPRIFHRARRTKQTDELSHKFTPGCAALHTGLLGRHPLGGAFVGVRESH
jgi:hypothetical protein